MSWFARIRNIPLHYKVVVPFIGLVAITALFAGPVARFWVSAQIQRGARQQLQNSQSAAIYHLIEKKRHVLLCSKVMAENRSVESAMLRVEPSRLLQALIPLSGALKVDAFVVCAPSGRVLVSVGGLVPVGSNIRDWELVRRGATEMNYAAIVEGDSGYMLAAVNPIRGPRGVIGLVIAGMSVDGILREFRDDLQVRMAIYRQGRLISSTMPISTRSLAISPELYSSVAGRRSALHRAVVLEGRPYRVVYFPTELQGKPVGVSAVFIRADNIIQAEQTVVRNVVALHSLLLFIMTVVGIAIARSITAPVYRMANAARSLAEGDLSSRVEVTGEDEIGKLGVAFNRMAESLRGQTQDLTKRVTELSTLYDMSKILGSTLDLSELLNMILDSTLLVFGADIGYVMLVDERTGELSLEAWRVAGGAARRDKMDVGETMAEWVAKEGRPLLFSQQWQDRRLRRAIAESETKSAICVPLRSKDRIIGVITVSKIRTATPFTEENVKLLSTIASQASISIENARLFNRLQDAYLSTVRALAAAVDAKDPYTRGHSEQVAKYALMLAHELNFSEQERLALTTAAYLHDIGKIGISDEILRKPGKLTDEEMHEVRHHSLIGANILSPIPFPWRVTPTVRHHHEWYSGDGYPAGLAGEEIPLNARILSLADAFDAMTSDRPYRKAMTEEQAIQELRDGSGTQFDPNLVELFVAAYNKLTRGVGEERREVLVFGQERQEIRAIFITLAESLFEQYSKLGGPSVARNLEKEMNEYMRRQDLPVVMRKGRFEVEPDARLPLAKEVKLYKDVLAKEVAMIEDAVGNRIVSHFFDTALGSLTRRFRQVAEKYGFDLLVRAH